MSDFLSNFKGKEYEKTLDKKEEAKKAEPKKVATEKAEASDQRSQQPLDNGQAEEDNFSADYTVSTGEEPKENPVTPEQLNTASENHDVPIASSSGEATEFDPSYQQKKKKQKILFTVLGILGIVILLFFYRAVTRVNMPDFTNKPLSEARTWATENKINLNIKQNFSDKIETNNIIKQEYPKGKKVKKGSKIQLNVSKGADPDEKLTLPDFSKMNEASAKKWVEENHADNLSIMSEFDENISKGNYIKEEFSDSTVTKEDYKRKDKLIVYYSKGKETFQKDITVPDFTGKAKSEVESWANTNQVNMTFDEIDSKVVQAGSIVSQSIAKGQKIAKKEAMSVQVSLGKAVQVPDFSQLSKDQVSTIQGLSVIVKEQFSTTEPYGKLLSQSISPGTKLTERDDNQVVVTYSAGRPYLKDLRKSQTLEGDLPKYFFDEFNSKGANVKYTVYYVDSAEPKGTIINMSTYGQYISTDSTVNIGVSKGNLEGESTSNKSAARSTASNAGDQSPNEEE